MTGSAGSRRPPPSGDGATTASADPESTTVGPAASPLRRTLLTGWLASLLGWATFAVLSGPRELRFDAAWYWRLQAELSTPLHLLDHADPLRGYAVPWVLSFPRTVLSPVTDDADVAIRLLGLVLVPALLSVVVPLVARAVSPRARITVPRILLLNVLFFLGWRNDLLYPLSDLPALTSMAIGVLLVLRRTSAWAHVGAGAAFGLAVNARPAYAAAVVVAVACLALVGWRRRELAVRTVALVAGVGLALLPQVVIGARHFEEGSPLPPESRELTRLQLWQGLLLDRYETYVGPEDQGVPPGGLRFVNPRLTDELEQCCGLDASVPAGMVQYPSVGEYVDVALDHPDEVLRAYAVHTLNGLDARGGTYLEELGQGGVLVPVVNVGVLTSALALLVMRLVRVDRARAHGATLWLTVVVVVSVASGVTGATEPRFLLPIHLTLLAVATLGWRLADLPRRPLGRLALGLGAVLAAVLWLAVLASTLGDLTVRPLGLDGAPEGSPSVPAALARDGR